jgi:hypothetical protein
MQACKNKNFAHFNKNIYNNTIPVKQGNMSKIFTLPLAQSVSAAKASPYLVDLKKKNNYIKNWHAVCL